MDNITKIYVRWKKRRSDAKSVLLFILIQLIFMTGCGQAESTQPEGTFNQQPAQSAEPSRPQTLQPLEGEQPQLAMEMTTGCVVRLDVAGDDTEYYGSGLVWDVQKEQLILVTAGHLLNSGELQRIEFADGVADELINGDSFEFAGGEMIGFVTDRAAEAESSLPDFGEMSLDINLVCRTSEKQDVGFVEIPLETINSLWANTAPTSAETQSPTVVSLHQRLYDTLDSYSALYVTASSETGAADRNLDAVLAEKVRYQPELEADVMILSCETEAGMSGAGVFDGYGNLIGMVIGGNGGETAALSMEQINEAYFEVYGIRRNTEDYSAENP